MSVHAKPDGASGELLFLLRDPTRTYSLQEVVTLVAKAEQVGLPLEKGSYVEQMTIAQLDALVNDPTRRCDA
jgi:hypothetical protein